MAAVQRESYQLVLAVRDLEGKDGFCVVGFSPRAYTVRVDFRVMNGCREIFWKNLATMPLPGCSKRTAIAIRRCQVP